MNRDLEAGERAATDSPDPTLQLPPGSPQFAVETSPASPPTVDDRQSVMLYQHKLMWKDFAQRKNISGEVNGR